MSYKLIVRPEKSALLQQATLYVDSGVGSAAHQVFVYLPEKTREIRDRVALFSNKTENKPYSWLKTSLSTGRSPALVGTRAFKWRGEHLVVRNLRGSGLRGSSTYTRRRTNPSWYVGLLSVVFTLVEVACSALSARTGANLRPRVL